MAMQDNGQPLPKFGEWDVNDPASAEGYTVIFSKAIDGKRTNNGPAGNETPRKTSSGCKKPAKRWLCGLA